MRRQSRGGATSFISSGLHAAAAAAAVAAAAAAAAAVADSCKGI